MPTLIQLHKKTLIENFGRIVEKLSKRLENYIEKPNEKNIHDIRITIRRLEAAYRILPKKIRKKQEIQNYVKEAKTLFKINTQIRDFDIICEKLEKQSIPKYLELINYLKNKRKNDLTVAHRLALKLKHIQVPDLKRKEVSGSKLNNRFQKIVTQLTKEIKQNIPLVISDEKKINELHKLRKDFKKLRYSIELVSYKSISLKSIKGLKKIQDLLGEIHDCDIILNYLNDVKGPIELSDILRDEILYRHEKYQQFIHFIQDKELILKI